MRDKAIRETLWKIIKLETGRNERGRIYRGESKRKREREKIICERFREEPSHNAPSVRKVSPTRPIYRETNEREWRKKKGGREKKKSGTKGIDEKR